ncbi:MAG: Gldg family protein [Steroidobacteraceae bacterium]
MTNNQASSRPMGKTFSGATALVALAVLFIGLTILITFVFRGARIDLTESNLYSIAPGTSRILKGLDEPVNLYFFFSQEASGQSPPLRAYAQRVRELLEEMAQRSGGKLRLSIVDPQPFSEDEDRATEFGLQAVPLGGRGENLYFGLAGTNSTDGREVIGFFQPDKEEFLEYDVASLIYKLGHTKRPTVGLMSSLPVDASFDQQTGRMQEGWASISQLRELLNVQTVAPDIQAVPEGIDVLMLIHPRELSPPTQFAIDQFVMRGGKLLAFIDPQSENDPMAAQMAQQMGGAMPPRSSSLGVLLDAWGVTYDSTKILGDRELGLTVSMRQGEPPSQHIAIVGFNHDSMDRKDVVTATLDSINVMTAGALGKKPDSKITLEPLIQSSAQSELLPAAKLAFLADSQSLLDGFKATGERYIVAARLHGKLPSAFPNGAPTAAAPSPAAPPAAALKESKGDANVIIVADTDILADPLWIRTQNVFGQRLATAWANNGDFVSNAVDNLAGSSDLISIRGRQSFFRPFTRVEELRRTADDQLRAKEKELDAQLKETESKLSGLEAGRGAKSSMTLSPEQEAELTRFQHERGRIRKELRDVRRSLDIEIERLGTRLKALNIALIPVLLAIGAIALAITRRRKLRAGRAAAHTG